MIQHPVWIQCPRCSSTHVKRRVQDLVYTDEEYKGGEMQDSKFYAWIRTELVAGYECLACHSTVGAGFQSVWERGAYCPRCECEWADDASEATNIVDHGMCIACHKAWQMGEA